MEKVRSEIWSVKWGILLSKRENVIEFNQIQSDIKHIHSLIGTLQRLFRIVTILDWIVNHLQSTALKFHMLSAIFLDAVNTTFHICVEH